MALHLANRGYVLETGRIVLEDDAKALLDNEQVKAAYLGEEHKTPAVAVSSGTPS